MSLYVPTGVFFHSNGHPEVQIMEWGGAWVVLVEPKPDFLPAPKKFDPV